MNAKNKLSLTPPTPSILGKVGLRGKTFLIPEMNRFAALFGIPREGRLAAGEQRRFRAKERLEITGGNSSALLLELNGMTVPPLGPPGQPGKMTLTREDLKKLRGGQH